MVCGEERFENDETDVLLNPTVIVEVLSDSTEAYDRGRKFEHYQAVGSLREYVLISHSSRRIERFVRCSGRSWIYSDHREVGEPVGLESIDCELELADVYAKVF